MRTPCIYTKKLKEKVITKDMLLDCLFSVNKRAKNFRDKERELKEKIAEVNYPRLKSRACIKNSARH